MTQAQAQPRMLNHHIPLALSDELQKLRQPPTRAAWMHLVYLLQHIYNVPLGYHFTLYTQGPQASEVGRNLDIARQRLHISMPCTQDNPYPVITPGPMATEKLRIAHIHCQPYMDSISDLASDFGHLTASQLGLRTSLVYLDRHSTPTDDNTAQELLVQAVHELKPHVLLEEIREALRELQERNILHLVKHLRPTQGTRPYTTKQPSEGEQPP